VAAADAANDSATPTTSPAAAPILDFTGSKLFVRFLDWNPDLRAARGLGVAIRYDSVSNRVLCDGCAVAGGSAGSAVPSLGGSGSNPSDGSGFSGGPASGGGVAASAGSGPQGGGAARGGPIDR
jgi:hypothetical protein